MRHRGHIGLGEELVWKIGGEIAVEGAIHVVQAVGACPHVAVHHVGVERGKRSEELRRVGRLAELAKAAIIRERVDGLAAPGPRQQGRSLQRARHPLVQHAVGRAAQAGGNEPAVVLRCPGHHGSRIPAEQFVAAVAVQRHHHDVARHPRQVVARYDRHVGQWLPVVPDDFRQGAHHIRPQHALVQLHAEVLRHAPGKRTLVELGVVKAHGDRLDRRFALLRRQRGDERRVDAARQEDADGAIGHQSLAHGTARDPLHLGEHFLLMHRRLGGIRHVPVALHHAVTGARVERQPVRGRQREDALPHRHRRGHGLVREVGVDGARVHRRALRKQLEQGVQRRGEGQRCAAVGIEERLLTRPVAGQVQRAFRGIPDGQRKLPVDAANRLLESPPAHAMQQHFRVGMSAKPARRLEFRAQPLEIVDLAVEHDDVLRVVARHRLVAGDRQVDDGQPARAEADALARPHAAVIGAAMDHARVGALHTFALPPGPRADDSADGAHVSVPAPGHGAAPARASKYSPATRSHA